MPDLNTVALQLVADGRGIVAADESIKTMSARLEAEGIRASPASRRDYRQLLVTAPGLREAVSGVILCDETFNQQLSDGTPFPDACHEQGILPGIKVDAGTSPLEKSGGALVTEGLDGLAARLTDYAARGAAFAKWRAVIDPATVSDDALEVNAHRLGRYAALCQESGLVPIVEPEVLCDGDHELGKCAEVTERTLAAVFDHLDRNRVDLAAIVLKPNMVTPGLATVPMPPQAVASATLGVLRAFVPQTVPGIAFLSGGQTNAAACSNLTAINDLAGSAPWSLTYSFGRALVSDALRTWQGRVELVELAQDRLLQNCARASAASRSGTPAARS